MKDSRHNTRLSTIRNLDNELILKIRLKEEENLWYIKRTLSKVIIVKETTVVPQYKNSGRTKRP